MEHSNVMKEIWRDTKVISRYIWAHQCDLWLHVGLGVTLLVALACNGLAVLPFNLPGYANKVLECNPAGDFDFYSTYDSMKMKHFFQITLGFGTFTFAQAKAIDILWDVVVGRGGQLVLSIVTYIVFSKCLNRLLETPGISVSYNTFRAIVFEPPSLLATAKFYKDFKSRLSWRARWSFIWFVFASIYVVSFPTILSAMSGYSPNVKAYFKTGSGKVEVSTDTFRRVRYRIKDANRIEGLNLTTPYLVSQPADKWGNFYTDSITYCSPGLYDPACGLASAVQDYIQRFKARTPQSVDSYLNIVQYYFVSGARLPPNKTSHRIPSPTLDIEEWDLCPDSMECNPPQIYTVKDSNVLYTLTELKGNGTCDNLETYMWGFSFLQLFMFSIVTSVWVLGMYIMWNDAFWNSRIDHHGRRMGFYRGVIDVSDAMRKDVLTEPNELASESRIREMLAAQKNQGGVEFRFDYSRLPVSRMKAFQSWRKDVPSLCGWTKTWTRLHWVWFTIFNYSTILAIFLGSRYASYQTVCVVYAVIGCTIGLVFLAMFCTGLGCTLWRWTRQIRCLNMQRRQGLNETILTENSPESRRSSRTNIWTRLRSVRFTIFNCGSIPALYPGLRCGDYMAQQILGCTLGLIFFGILWIGLDCTQWTWTEQFRYLILRRRGGHSDIGLIETLSEPRHPERSDELR